MRIFLVLLAAIISMSTGVHAGSVYLVEVSQLDGSEELMGLSSEEARKVESDIRNEARYHSKALQNAQAAWIADETTKDERFPARMIQPRRARRLKLVRSMEEAETLIGRYEERTRNSLDRQIERQREKERSDARAHRGTDRERMQKKAREERDKEAQEAQEAEMEAAAIKLYQQEIDRLIHPSSAAPPPADAVVPPPADQGH